MRKIYSTIIIIITTLHSIWSQIPDTLCQGNNLPDEQKIQCYLDFCIQHNNEDSLLINSVLDHVKILLTDKTPKQLKLKYYFSKGYILYYRDCIEKSIACFDTASAFIETQQNWESISDLYLYWGAGLRMSGQFKLAESKDKLSLQLAEANNHAGKIARAYRELGVVAQNEGDFSKAIDLYQNALKWYYEVNDLKGRASVYNNLSLLNQSIDNNQLALELLQKSQEIYAKIGDNEGLAVNDLNKGVTNDKMGNFIESNRCFFKALHYFDSTSDQRRVALLDNNIGSVYGKTNKPDSAIYYIDKAIKMYKSMGNLPGESSSLHSMGKFFDQSKNFPKAIQYYLLALDIADQIGAKPIKAKILADLAQCYNNCKQYDKAYQTQKNLTELNSLIWDDKSSNQLADLEALYHTEQKERENLELQYQNEVITRKITNQRFLIYASSAGFIILAVFLTIIYLKNKALNAKNREITLKQDKIGRQNKALATQKNALIEMSNDKDRFFSIAAQNLYEPVGTIYKMLEHVLVLQRNGESVDFTSFIKTSKEAAVQAFNLLENLYYWARIQQGQIEYDPTLCKIKPLVEQIVTLQQPKATSKMMIIRIEIDENLEGYFDQKLIEIVMRNLVENAVKFSTRSGEVVIKGWEKNSRLLLKVSDNGVGMTRDQIEKIFSNRYTTATLGTHGEKGGGLGLILAKAFVDRNLGNIQVDSSIAEGTTVTINLPLSRNQLV